MDKTYEPDQIEQRWYKHWEDNAYFSPSGDGESYAILIPPPNVTGTLHMGHAFQHTLQDALIRHHRMRGHNTLWQPGTDHAGIATQMVVERQLNAEGKTRHDLGREEFIRKVWEWKEYSGGTITTQMRRLGDSTDWSREAFTMDPGMSHAVTTVFEKLYDDGLIYRGKRLVNWDPVLLTALSDLEVESHEENGHLWHLEYPLADGSGKLTVATTRPETMLGDTAVAVHPDDERYAKLVGKTIKLPLTGREIPIVADDYVDPEFGSGCVKITPAHDFNDYEIGQRHGLLMINIFTSDAKIRKDAAVSQATIRSDSHADGMQLSTVSVGPFEHDPIPLPEKYRGMDRFDARKAVVADLEAAGALVKVEDHKLMVPRGDRSNAVVEPYLTDQWYMKMRDEDAAKDLGGMAIKSVESGEIKFVPENWSKTYYNWMHNLQDWCISRQLWWGHRIPAWYDEDGNYYVAQSEAEVRSKYSLGDDVKLRQDDDVLDTWFSSALWPFATLGWPEKMDDVSTFLPTNVLVTGFDIIFFWVARMIMMTKYFIKDASGNGIPPFKEIYITGLIRDEHGQKMSKSKGNVIDPIDLIDGIELETLVEKRTSGMMQPKLREKIEKNTRKTFPNGIQPHGTDALRFTLTALASPSRDINFDLGRLEGYRNFCNKIWNASRFVLMNTEEQDCGVENKDMEFSAADRWIQSRFRDTVADVHKYVKVYRFDQVANAIHDFTWHEFCDWYLELSKPTLVSDDATDAQKRGTRHTLVTVLESLLRLTHPYMPFITEEIWQRVAPLAGKQGETIMLQPYPEADDFQADVDAEAQIEWAMNFILGIRRIRGEMDISPSKPVPVILENASANDHDWFKAQEPLLKFLARLENVTITESASDIPESAVALLGKMKIHVPMAGLIDKDAELARLDKLIEKTGKNLEGCRKKLSNESFVSNAPAEVVEKERARVADMESELKDLEEQRERIASL
jgi:valyl-tRNA synthetase